MLSRLKSYSLLKVPVGVGGCLSVRGVDLVLIDPVWREDKGYGRRMVDLG